jgi:hypothetical protein
MPTTVLVVPKRQMIRLLHSHHALSEFFMNKFKKLGFSCHTRDVGADRI